MNNKINSLQLSSIIFSQILSLTLGFDIFNILRLSNIDSYITIILQLIINFIPLLLILYIAHYKPNLNIIEKINTLFPKPISFIINLIITIILLITSITILFSISNFIINEYLPNTPIIYISIIFAIIIYIILSKGIETISRVSIFIPLISICFIIIMIIGLIPEFKITNFYPILEFSIKKPLYNSILHTFITTSLLFNILIIPKNNIIDKNNYNKSLIISYIIATIINLIIIILTIAILGKYLINIYQYPEYIALRKINLFNFINRIENILSLQWIYAIFITLSLNFYYLTKYIKNNNNNYKIIILLTIFIIIFNIIITTNILFKNIITNLYPYILSIITIFIIIISITIYLKRKQY